MNNETFDKLWSQFKQLHRKEELRQLVNLVEWFGPTTILELGVCHGGSFKMWEQVLAYDGLLIGIDRLNVIQWDWTGSEQVKYIQADLDSFVAVEQVLCLLDNFELGRAVDFLYIDADHWYEPVKRHFELYAPLVRGGGLIALHDIRDNKGSGYGVGRFFDELKEQYRWLEILVPITEELLGADGIGVIFK